MDTRNRDTLSAVTARQRSRARLGMATLAIGAAGLAGAGAFAWSLPAATRPVAAVVSAPAGSAAGAVHATSGGSAVAATRTLGGSGTSAVAPASSSGGAHVVSGGS